MLPPFHHSACKRRQSTTDQSSITPSSTAATPSPPPSAAFRSQRSQQNHPPANSLPRQIPIDGQVLTRCPAGSFFGGFRRPAFLPGHRSRRAGIRTAPASETLPETSRSPVMGRTSQTHPLRTFAHLCNQPAAPGDTIATAATGSRLLSGCNVARRTVRMRKLRRIDLARQESSRIVVDVIGVVRPNSAWNRPITGSRAHPIGYRVVRA